MEGFFVVYTMHLMSGNVSQ